jgi:membrane dipeptidase
MLDLLYAAGLRSLGIVWSRPNAFGHGVPFKFPSSPDTGPGLTEAGRELVRACNERRILIDLSHLNEKGFWDVAGLSTAPLVATHSNAHSVCPHARNLTDRQLDAIRESGGMVGLNFATAFLRPDGSMNADTDRKSVV